MSTINKFQKCTVILLIFFLFCTIQLYAKPVGKEKVGKAAKTFLTIRYPTSDPKLAKTTTKKGKSAFKIKEVQPLVASGEIVGFISEMEPSGFVLFSADDQSPPVKFYSDNGTYENLPIGLRKVLELELSEDSAILNNKKVPKITSTLKRFSDRWNYLTSDTSQTEDGSSSTPISGTAILTTTWNQNYPYNYYCPVASGGPGGLAWAGCTATALAQVLRHHNFPSAVTSDHTFTDNAGSCQGTHSISDAGMGDYDWANMPSSISSSSPDAQKQAVGRLIYHCGVALESDYEADGTGAYPSDVPNVLQTYFNHTSGGYENKSSYTNTQWYNKIANDIDSDKPIFYSMWEADWSHGHAVVCDGYRNGNEMHLDLGWSGSGTAWYNLDSVSASGYTWTIHGAVFNITPVGNQSPGTPNSQYPDDGAIDVSITVDLGWSCSDPDGDTIYYTVYFEKDDSSPDTVIKNDSTGSNADPGTLEYDSHYYWKVRADDHNGGVSISPVWDFWTEPALGSLQAFIQPEEARSENAVWRVDGGAWHTSSYTQTGLSVGAHTVEFLSTQNWDAPVNQSVQITNNQTMIITGQYRNIADINSDDKVNVLDLSKIAQKWCLTNCDELNGWCEKADTNHSGDVGIDDLLIMAEHWLDGAFTSRDYIYYNDFDGNLDWTTSDNSVYINNNQYLYISADGVSNDDYAEKVFDINLGANDQIIIEQRVKLESDGLNYRLPTERIMFEDSSEISVTYLPSFDNQSYGWHFDGWTGIDDPGIPGEGYWTSATADYWVITRMVIASTGGSLYMKPDDLAKAWYSDQFSFITSSNWDHSEVTKIKFSQPWDSVNCIDYIKISSIDTQEGLVTYYKLDGTLGPVVDELANNDGVNNGAIRGVAGKIGNAFEFDGSSSWVESSLNAGITGNSDWTISFWMYTDNPLFSHNIISLGAYGTSFTTVGIAPGQTATELFVNLWESPDYNGGEGNEWFDVGIDLTGSWNHIAATYNGANLEFFVNGVSKKIKAAALNLADDKIYIGGRTGGYNESVNLYFDGWIDEVRIYNRALSVSEVQYLYQNP
ncbi:MAG: C10 family peptidase [Phycisphaerae bacterium]|nr:C10 family peptidase [Phycisphaerae bacterium]